VAHPIGREDRNKVLTDHLRKVAGIVRGLPDRDKPVRFESSSGNLEFLTAEIAMLRHAVLEKQEGARDLTSTLLAETLALRLKVSEDLKDFETASGLDDELEQEVVKSLERDLALGEGLVTDYRVVIDQLFVADHRDVANRLGEFRMAVRQDMSRVRQTLVGEGVELEPADETLSVFGGADEPVERLDLDGHLAGEEPARIPEEGAAPEDPTEAARRRLEELRRKKRHEARRARFKKRMKVWLTLLGIASAIGLGNLAIELIPAFELTETRKLTRQDFRDLPFIVSVESFPPSVFVRVNGHQWAKLGNDEQRAIVRRIGRVASNTGYNGVKVRDEEGKLLGEWIRGVGSYVFPR
jgi:hypothetical protein